MLWVVTPCSLVMIYRPVDGSAVHRPGENSCNLVGGYGAVREQGCGWLWCGAGAGLWAVMVRCGSRAVGGYGAVREQGSQQRVLVRQYGNGKDSIVRKMAVGRKCLQQDQ